MTLPAGADLTTLRAVGDVVERAHLLARAAHAEQVDKAGAPYFDSHLLDVQRRVAAYGLGRRTRPRRCCTTSSRTPGSPRTTWGQPASRTAPCSPFI